MTGDPLLALESAVRVHGEGATAVHALRGIDLDLPESELIVLLGASGSGKSTFLNIIGGLDHPTEGRIRLMNPPYTLSASPATIRRPPPKYGEHTRAILAELGYDDAAIDRMIERGAASVMAEDEAAESG